MGEKIIPKTIHYCWFGRGEMPELVKRCIKSWKEKLPDYQIILWNEDNFDVSSCLWTKTAYDAKKYAFVADYVRLKVLYEHGGIYLDTDIQMKKNFDDFLNQKMFLGFECNDVLSAGVIGCQPHESLILELLDYYNQGYTEEISMQNKSNALVMTQYLEQKYNLHRDNSEQIIAGYLHIYPKTYFNPRDFWGNWDLSKDTYCIHLYMGSWLPEKEQRKLQLRRNPLWLLLRRVYLQIKEIIRWVDKK